MPQDSRAGGCFCLEGFTGLDVHTTGKPDLLLNVFPWRPALCLGGKAERGQGRAGSIIARKASVAAASVQLGQSPFSW